MSRLCSARELRDAASSPDGVFALFYASWCPFSLAFLPVYEKRAAAGDAAFVRVLLDGNETLFDEHGVSVYPTVLFFKKGAVERRLDGTHLVGLQEKQLAELISSCLKDRA
jgi:thiol-disulfide isomerase/thioredoxin